MERGPYQATLLSGPDAIQGAPPYADTYRIVLKDGTLLELPIEPLPGGEQAIVLLMSNQTIRAPFPQARTPASLPRHSGQIGRDECE